MQDNRENKPSISALRQIAEVPAPAQEPLIVLAEQLRKLVGVTSVRDLSTAVCEGARRLLSADGATFVLSEGDQVYYAEEAAKGRLWKGGRFPSTACISGWAIRNRETAKVEDIYQDDRIPLDAYRPTFVRSLLSTPMLFDDEAVGAIGVYWATPREFPAQEVVLLRLLADAAARALNQARMLEERGAVDASNSADSGGVALNGQLLAVIAHDLRSPLMTVSMALGVLEKESSLSADRRRVLELVRRTNRRAANMVSQLTAYSELRANGSLPLNLAPARLDQLCEQALAEVRASHERANVVLKAREVEGLWDADRLMEAVANLLRNAIDHGDSTRAVTLTLEDRENEARLHVHNWGKPIPADAHQRLFKPFERLDRKPGSIGLGLFVTEQIVTAHGGSIALESTAARGTCFSVYLPKQPWHTGDG